MSTLAEIRAVPGRSLVVFSATWCRPCQAYKPALAVLAAEGVTVTTIDIDQDREIAPAFGVKSVPTTIVLSDGEPVSTFTGIASTERLREALAPSV